MNDFRNNLRYRKYYYYKKKNYTKKSLRGAAAFFVISVILLIFTVIYIINDDFNKKTSNSLTVSEPDGKVNCDNDSKCNNFKNLSNEFIRVVIKTSDFIDIYHENITMSAKTGLVISNDDNSVILNVKPDEVIDFNLNEQLKNNTGILHVKSQSENDGIYINSVKRSCGHPAYYGSFDIYHENDGYIIVNEVPLENYLYGVVPSEMPDSYDLEALKAQAVCARSYAARRMCAVAYPQYDAAVDDSVRYQVYNNYEITEKIKEAVDATKGEVAVFNGEIIDAYFYATSCGITGGGEVWSAKSGEIEYLNSVMLSCNSNNKNNISSEEEFKKYISEYDEYNYDCKSPWYRWQIKLDVNKLDSEWIDKYGKFKEIEIVSRSSGGIITGLNVVGESNSCELSSEYDIRDFFGKLFVDGEKQNGKMKNIKMLPSACFYICSIEKNIITIKGGGYGHGVGMSQTAADCMAKNGMKYNDILKFFYPGTDVVDNE